MLFLLAISLFKMALSEVQSVGSVSKHNALMCLTEKMCVLDKLCAILSYGDVGCDFDVN